MNEYITSEFLEMVYLSWKGFAYDLDKENPHRVKAIFKCIDKSELILIKSLLEDFWSDSKERSLLNRASQMKRELWIGGKFNPEFATKKYLNNTEKE